MNEGSEPRSGGVPLTHSAAQRRASLPPRPYRDSPTHATLRRMVRTILIVLLALWLLGFVLRAFGGLIHLLLIVALVIVIYRLLTNRPVW